MSKTHYEVTFVLAVNGNHPDLLVEEAVEEFIDDELADHTDDAVTRCGINFADALNIRVKRAT